MNKPIILDCHSTSCGVLYEQARKGITACYIPYSQGRALAGELLYLRSRLYKFRGTNPHLKLISINIDYLTSVLGLDNLVQIQKQYIKLFSLEHNYSHNFYMTYINIMKNENHLNFIDTFTFEQLQYFVIQYYLESKYVK